MTEKVILIRNLDCAGCAAELSEELNDIKGIANAQADFLTQKVRLEYENEEALQKAIYTISHFEEVEIVTDEEAPEEEKTKKRDLIFILLGAVFFAAGLILSLAFRDLAWYYSGSCYLACFALAGWSVALNAIKNFARAFKGGFHPLAIFDENVLMLVAAIGAIAIKEFMEAAAVMLLYQIGEYLQGLAVGSSRGAIKSLLSLKSESAILLKDGENVTVSPDTLQIGDIILLRKGDKAAADCRLIEGETELDTKSLTGESAYRRAAAGDTVLSGTVNVGNAVKAEVLRPSSESAAAKILNMVENSTANKAKPEKFITRFARIYTPVVCLIALLIAVVPPLFQGYNFSFWLVPAIEFLVISCPCALIISVPLTDFSGVGTLARCGVLAKGAVYLEELAKVKVISFDKTGTLTEGKFSVSKVHGDARGLELAAAVEKNSSHPLAQAFSSVKTELNSEDVREISGKGLMATVAGKSVLVGNASLLEENGVKVQRIESLSSVVYVAEEGELVSAIEIDDQLKEEAPAALKELKKAGIKRLAVLSGDSAARAESILKGLEIDELHAELLPEQKIERARELKKYGPLLYVGDGINDTPVMAESDVSMAMGALGSDAAIETGDFVLAGDSLLALPKAYRGAKKTKKIVGQNIFFSISVKVALMAVSVAAAATGAFTFPIWAAVFGDVGVMLLAVLNSMRMRH